MLWVKVLLAMPSYHTGVPVQSWLLHAPYPLPCSGGLGSADNASRPPDGVPATPGILESLALVSSAWPTQNHCNHLGTEPVDKRSLSHPLSPHAVLQINKPFRKRKVPDHIYNMLSLGEENKKHMLTTGQVWNDTHAAYTPSLVPGCLGG